jgi:hypothetical protein
VGVETGFPKEVAATLSCVEFAAVNVSATKIVSGDGATESESPSGANVLVVSLEHPARGMAASPERMSSRRTERITISRSG